MAQRGADYGVWVVPSEDRLPARAPALREVGGDKLFVVYDPEEGRVWRCRSPTRWPGRGC